MHISLLLVASGLHQIGGTKLLAGAVGKNQRCTKLLADTAGQYPSRHDQNIYANPITLPKPMQAIMDEVSQVYVICSPWSGKKHPVSCELVGCFIARWPERFQRKARVWDGTKRDAANCAAKGREGWRCDLDHNAKVSLTHRDVAAHAEKHNLDRVLVLEQDVRFQVSDATWTPGDILDLRHFLRSDGLGMLKLEWSCYGGLEAQDEMAREVATASRQSHFKNIAQYVAAEKKAYVGTCTCHKGSHSWHMCFSKNCVTHGSAAYVLSSKMYPKFAEAFSGQKIPTIDQIAFGADYLVPQLAIQPDIDPDTLQTKPRSGSLVPGCGFSDPMVKLRNGKSISLVALGNGAVPGLHADFKETCFCQCQVVHKDGTAVGLVKDLQPSGYNAPPPLGWSYGHCPRKYCCLNKECPQTMYIRHRKKGATIQPSTQCSGEATFIVDTQGGLQGVHLTGQFEPLSDFRPTGYP
jgi:hypothetical protein